MKNSTKTDIRNLRRPQLLCMILQILKAARPIGATERLILAVVNDVIAVSEKELHSELDFLADRGFVERSDQAWCLSFC